MPSPYPMASYYDEGGCFLQAPDFILAFSRNFHFRLEVRLDHTCMNFGCGMVLRPPPTREVADSNAFVKELKFVSLVVLFWKNVRRRKSGTKDCYVTYKITRDFRLEFKNYSHPYNLNSNSCGSPADSFPAEEPVTSRHK